MASDHNHLQHFGEKRLVFCDLDSTVTDTRHRHHAAPHNDPTKTWYDYGQLCSQDAPIAGTVRLLQLLHEKYPIHLVSGRDNGSRDLTEEWLRRHDVPWDSIHLVEINSPVSNSQHKIDRILSFKEQGHEPVLMLEDWPEVAQNIHAATGVPILIVNPCYDDTPMGYFATTHL